jgi:hypothetical protein
MSIEMTPEPRRELILDMVSDLATDLLDYDRKEYEYLPRAAIEKGHRGRESTPEEIVGRLRDQLHLFPDAEDLGRGAIDAIFAVALTEQERNQEAW